MSSRAKKKGLGNKFFEFCPIEREAGLAVPEPYAAQGAIQDWVVVSVPTTMTQRSAEELHTSLEGAFRRSVLLVTHNIQFMRVRELSRAETTKLIKTRGLARGTKASEAADQGSRLGCGGEPFSDSGVVGRPVEPVLDSDQQAPSAEASEGVLGNVLGTEGSK